MKYGVSPKDVLPFINEVSEAAGKKIMSYFRGDFAIDSKDTRVGGIDIVTDADRASEEILLEAINREFPDHDILTEERTTNLKGSRYMWVIDPLDGTVNFAHGLPVFCISIALTDGGIPIAGIVYDPVHYETFSAIKNHGAFFNGNLTRVSEANTLDRSIVATGFPYDRAFSPENNVAEFSRIVTRVQGIRRGGSAALDLAYVASGRIDGFWELKLKPWDMAAGMLLVSEARGRVTDRHGAEPPIDTPSILATNGLIHDLLIQLLSEDGENEPL